MEETWKVVKNNITRYSASATQHGACHTLSLTVKAEPQQSDRVRLNSRFADQLWNLMQPNLLGLSTLISEEKHSNQPHSTSVSNE